MNKSQIPNPKSQQGNNYYNKKYIVRILTFGFGILILLFAASLSQSADPSDRSEIEIIIPKGASAYTIQSILEEAGILRKESSFAFFARLLGYSKHFQAG